MNQNLTNTIPEFFQRLFDRTRHTIARYPVLVTAVYLASIGNFTFWSRFSDAVSGHPLQKAGFSISFFLLITLLTVFLLQIFRFRYLLKPVLIFILIASAFASYFMGSYGIMIDTTMVYNVLETDVGETTDLLTGGMLLHVLVFGLLPAIVIYKTRIVYSPPLKQLVRNSTVILVSLAAIAGNMLLFSSEYASFFRNHHHLRYLVNPVNYIYSFSKVTATALQDHDTTPIPIGTDAHRSETVAVSHKRSLIVVVVGETARAMNFSLNGYNRNTNPELQKLDIINYPNFYSCGTSTHVSLPCMFSAFGREDFDEALAKRYEKLPDVLQRAGIEVLWRDNNSGCKGICKNVPTDDMAHLKLDNLCNDAECYDEVMLVNLKELIENKDKDTVIILHQKGSHGPAYYQRHPKQFQVFTPECVSNELSNCQSQEIINAYDNTILYTDHFLSRVITLLKEESQRFDTAMLYVSDHGESLGENNIYLHSLPYMIAPEEQTRVPFITWFSDDFLKDNHLDKSCLKQHATRHYSHDNLFHSLLGLTHVSTSVYHPEQDIFKSCEIKLTGNPDHSTTS